MTGKQKEPKRQYPAFYEKAVPVALAVLIVVVIAMLVFTVGVALGFFAG